MTVPESLQSLRVAIVHDFLNQHGGAENVVALFAEMFPGAPIYTSVYDAKRMPHRWRALDIRTSFMQRISPRLHIAKTLFPLYPFAFESFDLSEYDLVLSSTTAFAKGVITRPHTCHVCYCNTPSRFLWTTREYLRYESLPSAVKAVIPWMATPLRVWDYTAAQRVDFFIAGSYNAARRIRKYYRRESDVLQPPIDVAAFRLAESPSDYYLVLSRLQPYKRIDLAVEACTRLGVPLHVIGDGPDRARLERLAGPSVRFFGRVSDAEVRDQLASCRALLFPGEEDFGLTPLEAQASGRPVIAYGAGGALETVRDGKTGVHFRPQTAEALSRVLSSFEDRFDPAAIRRHACRFDVALFKERLYSLLAEKYERHEAMLASNSDAI
jgi:glycosyltransferase involved in cell wall biosynthesis